MSTFKLLLPLVGALSFSAMASADSNQNNQSAQATAETATKQCLPMFQHKLRKLHSKEMVDVCKLVEDKVVMVVNTASNCGFTPQFEGLENLYTRYSDQGFVILGFPSDDFFQEEDDEKDTAEVCYKNYGVNFPMFATTPVRGSDAHPIFAQLAEQTASPKWNFYKYLVSRDGKQIEHFNSRVAPDDEAITSTLTAMLQK